MSAGEDRLAGQQSLRLDLALIHYPVCDRRREVIGSAVTNLDLHDLARAGKTYGVRNFFVVTPFAEQQRLVEELVAHWRLGHGARYNQDRGQALALITVCPALTDVFGHLAGQGEGRPLTVATSARPRERSLPYAALRRRLWDGEPCLLLLGTGWGLAPEVLSQVDEILPPVGGGGDYNHLSVRSAGAIILDRLLGDRV